VQLNYQTTIANPAMGVVGTGALPVIPGTTTAGKYQNVTVVGNYAYVAGFASPGANPVGMSLVIYDITDPTNPFVTGWIPTQTNPWNGGAPGLNGTYCMVIQNGYAYITSGLTFYVVNVQNPYYPYNVGRCAVTGSPGTLYSVAMSGNYAYISTQSKGLTVVDCTNPLLPVQVFQEGGTLNKSVGVCVANGYVFTTNYQTTAPWTVRYLKIWNISTPSTPSLITTYTLPAGTKPGQLSVNGNYAYVTDFNTNSVQIVDITNVNSPNYISSMAASASFGTLESAATNTTSLDGDFAYITSGSSAVFGGAVDCYNITNPATPVLVSTYTEGVPSSVGYLGAVLYNNNLYIADYGPAGGTGSTLVVLSTLTGTSAPIDSRNLTAVSVQLSNVGSSATGVCILEGSDDSINPTNWSDIPSTSTPISGTAVYLIPKTDISYQYVRVAYTSTGTGGLNVALKGLEP